MDISSWCFHIDERFVRAFVYHLCAKNIFRNKDTFGPFSRYESLHVSSERRVLGNSFRKFRISFLRVVYLNGYFPYSPANIKVKFQISTRIILTGEDSTVRTNNSYNILPANVPFGAHHIRVS